MTYRDESRGLKRSYGSYGNRDPPFKRMNGGGNDDYHLTVPNWHRLNLPSVTKNFYKEHPNITALTNQDVGKILKEKEITAPAGCPKPITSFQQSGLPEYILNEFKQVGYTEPTPIQSQSWPVIVSGNDMVGIAETGSGKTMAFLIPSLIHINAQKPIERGEGPIALIVAPTRELALQTESQVKIFSKQSRIRYISVYGGVPKYPQAAALKEGVDIVVATPGRLLDFLSTKTTNLERTTYLVLDEADRMLDMGFEKSIRQIIAQIRPDRQTVLFSATWPKAIQNLAREFMTRPIQINIGSLGISSCKNVEQKFEIVEDRSKLMKLLFYLKQLSKTDKTLIFVATKSMTWQLCEDLRMNGFYCGAISGDKKQYEREQVLRRFREGDINILIGTDVASRGIDIKDIMVVINFDFPNTIEDYVHRIGRTGRANASGRSYTLMTSKNANKAADLIQLLKNDKKQVPKEVERLSQMYGGYRNNRRYYR